MNTYKITIRRLIGKNRLLSYTKKNLEKLIAKFDYIQKAIITHKTYIPNAQVKPTKTQSLEFVCESLNILSESEFINFIETMHNYGFSSSKNNNIALIDLNTNYKIIYSYNFQSLTKQEIEERIKKKNKSTYQTQILYCKSNIQIESLKTKKTIL
jgi:hypothetical protein